MNHWKKAGEHVFVSLILLSLMTCAPSFIGSLVVKGVDKAMAWESDETRTVSETPTTIVGRVRGIAERATQATQEGAVAVARVVVRSGAFVLAWLFTIFGLFVAIYIELRRVLATSYEGLLSLPKQTWNFVKRRQ